MFDGFFREKLLSFCVGTQKFKWWLHEAVEQKGRIDQQSKSSNLQPLERFPSKAKRNDPDEERSASVNGGARGGTDGASNGQSEEVEAAIDGVRSLSLG